MYTYLIWKKNYFNSIQLSWTKFFKIVILCLIFQNFFWLGRAQLFRMIRKEEYWPLLYEKHWVCTLHCVENVQIRSFFWFVFSHIWLSMRKSVEIQENTQQKIFRVWTHFMQCCILIVKWYTSEVQVCFYI